MKNLMLFVHPSHGFIREHATSIKIEIDNNLSLGWVPEDILLATNFPFEYNGVKSLLVSDDDYDSSISPCASIIFVIVDLFKRGLIQKDELYWYHDSDLYQLENITEDEINLRSADMGVVDWGEKISASSFFFKESARDIFNWIKEVMIKYKIDEEVAIMDLLTKDLLPQAKDINNRIKKLNITYDFEPGYINQFYEKAIKPLKTVHFHYTRDRLLDSAMYGKNSLKTKIMPERLIKIFHKHSVQGFPLKKMKNLLIYLNSKKKFLNEDESLIKHQIDKSLSFGWDINDIILITNYPFEYNGVNSKIMENKINISDVIFELLNTGVIKESELWWYHDFGTFQKVAFNSSQIDLEDKMAGFIEKDNMLGLENIFF